MSRLPRPTLYVTLDLCHACPPRLIGTKIFPEGTLPRFLPRVGSGVRDGGPVPVEPRRKLGGGGACDGPI